MIFFSFQSIRAGAGKAERERFEKRGKNESSFETAEGTQTPSNNQGLNLWLGGMGRVRVAESSSSQNKTCTAFFTVAWTPFLTDPKPRQQSEDLNPVWMDASTREVAQLAMVGAARWGTRVWSLGTTTSGRACGSARAPNQPSSQSVNYCSSSTSVQSRQSGR